jgi:hypothetical protein
VNREPAAASVSMDSKACPSPSIGCGRTKK